MADDAYPVRYVAFLDIIGFRELINRLNADPTQLEFTRSLMHNIHQPNHTSWDAFFTGSDLKAESISDAVALSSSPTRQGLIHMFAAIELLSIKLLRAGIFLRGAVVKDRLFHDDEMVFGEGLVRAYHYESTVARYPRIMVPRELRADIKGYIDEGFKEFFGGQVRQSTDGPQYWHVLRRFDEIKTRPLDHPQRPARLATLIEIRDKIQSRLDEAVDNPKHFEKVHWFASYWNEVFFQVDGLEPIQGAGLRPLYALK
jgi:hypothetical protein